MNTAPLHQVKDSEASHKRSWAVEDVPVLEGECHRGSFLCLSILLVTGMLVVTVGGVVLGESTVAWQSVPKSAQLASSAAGSGIR